MTQTTKSDLTLIAMTMNSLSWCILEFHPDQHFAFPLLSSGVASYFFFKYSYLFWIWIYILISFTWLVYVQFLVLYGWGECQ